MDERRTIRVVAAVIVREGRVFATQRGYGEWKGWWEFPGGKIEVGEGAEAALRREIREELDADVVVGPLLTTVDYDYPAFHLTMHCFLCHLRLGHLSLIEHEAARWLDADDLYSVRWLPADLDVLPAVCQRLSGAIL